MTIRLSKKKLIVQGRQKLSFFWFIVGQGSYEVVTMTYIRK